MFSSQTLWVLYFFGLAVLFFLPTITALIKHTKGLLTVVGLNVVGIILPVPCWIAAMGFAVCGVSKRPPRKPAVPREPARMLLVPADLRAAVPGPDRARNRQRELA